MTADTSRRDLAQAALEGIALRVGQVLDAMARRVALSTTLSIDGGLSRSPAFARFLADATGRRGETRAMDELTAFGCASLAALALGASLPAPAGADRAFDPRDADRNAWRQRFADAVERSRSWR